MGVTWPFPTKSQDQLRRIDEGQDLQYPGTKPVAVRAIAPGTISQGGPDPNGFGDSYPIEELDAPLDGFSSVYYGHVTPSPGVIGKHVSAGTVIAHTSGLHSGGDAYNDPNWLEVGFYPPSWDKGPAMASVLGNASATSGSVDTTGAVSCPSIWSNPVGWAACNSLKKSPLGRFVMDPVDALERAGLVIFGALLLLIGIAMIGFGPATRVLGFTASASRSARSVRSGFSGSSLGGPSTEKQASRQRRLELAEKNASLGERKLALKEKKERRLAGYID